MRSISALLMSDYELMQWAGLGAGALVFIAIIVAIARWMRAMSAIWPNTAKKFGLVFKDDTSGGGFSSQSKSQQSLDGAIEGIPIRVVSTWERTGNMRRSGTQVFARAPEPTQHRFNVQIERGVPKAKFHLVPTGDAAFDRGIALKSEAAEAVRALATPDVRTALWRTPAQELSLSYDRGEIVLSFPGNPTTTAELEGPIAVVLAAAKAKLP